MYRLKNIANKILNSADVPERPNLELREDQKTENPSTSHHRPNFFYRTALGRTLSGKNKTGQAIGVALETILSFTPVLKWSEITGHIDSAKEAMAIGQPLENLNLKQGTITKIKYGVIAGLILLLILGLIATDEVLTILQILNLI